MFNFFYIKKKTNLSATFLKADTFNKQPQIKLRKSPT